MTTRTLMLLGMILLLRALPADAQETLRRTRDGQPDVVGVQGGDPRMEAAMERARETLPAFERYLERAVRGEVFAQLKVEFTENGETEHMWVGDVTRLENGRFRGTLQNEPMYMRKVSLGSTVTFSRERVTDWMVVDNGALIGGFTILELRRRMDDAERAALDRDLPFRLPADSAVWNPPPPG